MPSNLLFNGVLIDVHFVDELHDNSWTAYPETPAEGFRYGYYDMLKKIMVDWLKGLQPYTHGRKDGEGWTLSTVYGPQDAFTRVWLYNRRLPGDKFLPSHPLACTYMCALIHLPL